VVRITYLNNHEAVARVDDAAEHDLIHAHFKKKVPGSEWIMKRRGGYGCFHHKFWNPETCRIGRGLVQELKELLKEKGIPYGVDKNGMETKGEDMSPESVKEWSKTVLNPSYAIRDDQADSLAVCIRHKQLICQLPTGYGKSMVIYGLARRIIETSDRKILIMVPSKQLVSQLASNFKKYGWDGMEEHLEMMHSDLADHEKPTFKKRILVSTWQSLQKKDVYFFDRYKAVIVDEAHHANADKQSGIIKKCYNADYRVGFTGTMPKDLYESYMIQQYLGPVYCPSTYSDMKEMGILSNCMVKIVMLKYPDDACEKWCRRGYADETKFLEEHPGRMQAMIDIVKSIPPGENILVMFSHTKHLDLALESFKSGGIEDIKVIKGDVKVQARESIRSSTEDEEHALIFATYGCVQEGIDIKRLHNVILAASTKSEIRVLQTIGRGLRTHHTKEKAIIWDLADDLRWNGNKNHTIKHAAERFDYYQEQNYEIQRMAVKVPQESQ